MEKEGSLCVRTWSEDGVAAKVKSGRYILQPLLNFSCSEKTKEIWIIEIIDGPGRKKKNNGSFKLGLCPIKSFSWDVRVSGMV